MTPGAEQGPSAPVPRAPASAAPGRPVPTSPGPQTAGPALAAGAQAPDEAPGEAAEDAEVDAVVADLARVDARTTPLPEQVRVLVEAQERLARRLSGTGR